MGHVGIGSNHVPPGRKAAIGPRRLGLAEVGHGRVRRRSVYTSLFAALYLVAYRLNRVCLLRRIDLAQDYRYLVQVVYCIGRLQVCSAGVGSLIARSLHQPEAVEYSPVFRELPLESSFPQLLDDCWEVVDIYGRLDIAIILLESGVEVFGLTVAKGPANQVIDSAAANLSETAHDEWPHCVPVDIDRLDERIVVRAFYRGHSEPTSQHGVTQNAAIIRQAPAHSNAARQRTAFSTPAL